MKLRNTSEKIIHVGTHILLPGQEINIAKSATETPSMRTLVAFNLISLTEDAVPTMAVAEEEPDIAEEAAPVDEEKPKRGRKTSK